MNWFNKGLLHVHLFFYKAIAYMDHRNYVIPDDIKKVIYDVLSHRLILTYDAKVKDVVIQDVIKSILKEVKELG